MKIKGESLKDPNEDFIVIPRGDRKIVFRARAVLDMDEFTKLCPEPKPPMKLLKGGIKEEDRQNPRYKTELETYGRKRMGYMILKSLEITEDLEWEKMSLADPSTWGNFEEEMKESGFSQMEQIHIINLVMNVNALSETRLEQARKDFLLGQQEQVEQLTSHQEGQLFTQSGEPVSG